MIFFVSHYSYGDKHQSYNDFYDDDNHNHNFSGDCDDVYLLAGYLEDSSFMYLDHWFTTSSKHLIASFSNCHCIILM